MTLALLACCSCNMMPNNSRFAVRCSGTETMRNDSAPDNPEPASSPQLERTYVIDAGQKAIYRIGSSFISNYCNPDGKCALLVTGDRVKGLFSEPRLASAEKNASTNTQFTLDRDSGDLKLIRHFSFFTDGPIDSTGATSTGTFSCVPTDVPSFRMPD
jgi:hypothetical protein